MEIRQVEQKEIEGVLNLIDEYDRPRSPRPSYDDMRTIHKAILETGGCVVGAFSTGSMVGTCTINICANLSWSGRPYAIIENVIVSKSHRNQGIGKAILEYATDFAQQAGCYKAALMTGSKEPATHRLYESAGFSASKQGYQIRFNA
ncbi:GNAT family N-acetyltransferase [Halomonas sp. SpR1]|uniref:GNAT family N-acetyltransferase n=1 Tax=unclassified Halomonas TaxID=2609666 RepID=UPI000B20DEEA|nr:MULTISPECIES: GNAT family N-acetyltransferase [unclassified Halomonas]MBT2788248.1 GNAT family N-acetyltransferase [Halomonas sp. ISL-106]MBT2795997.1 GNAT family N-acetyltransferase [Halomonas sp. ISL-104]MDQ7734459.1 GNAT family N-acetyltransferase [Halomonas sp. SpR1]